MSIWRVTWALARRSLILIPRVLSTFIPSIVMPVFLTVAFAGAFSGLVLLPGFPAESSLDWFIPMTTLQGAAFAGVTTGLGLARDLESGFFDRYLLSPAPRVSIISGHLMASMLRATIPVTLMVIVALVAGAHFKAGALTVLTLALAAWGSALAFGAYAITLALRFKTTQAAPIMQTGVFLTVFLSTAQMPLDLLTGWLHTVARFNPMTNVLALAREGFLGDVTWSQTWPGLLSLAGMGLVMSLFALRALQRAVP